MNKIGLVLEGGALRAMFSCGVTDVLMENGIHFDGMIGASAGACFGCNVKSGQIGRAIRFNMKYAGDKRYCSWQSFLKTGNMFNQEFGYRTIPYELDPFDFEAFKASPMEFYAVATDVTTGYPVYKKISDLSDKGSDDGMKWLMASAAMPLVQKVVEIKGLKLLDGGSSDSIPLKHLEQLGYSKNLVVLTQPKNFVKKPNKAIFLMKLFLGKYPNFIRTMQKRHIMYNEETKYVFEQEKLGNVLVICPEKPLGISRTEKNPDELKRIYEEGRKIALSQLEKIKKFVS